MSARRTATANTTAKAVKMAAWDANFGNKAPSPMEPFKNGLRVLKYVGLPLEFNHDATEFTEKRRLLKCILVPGGESNVQAAGWSGRVLLPIRNVV